MNYGLEKAGKIVFAGSGMGGTGVIYWIDYLRQMVSQPDKIYGVVDSAIVSDPMFMKYLP